MVKYKLACTQLVDQKNVDSQAKPHLYLQVCTLYNVFRLRIISITESL